LEFSLSDASACVLYIERENTAGDPRFLAPGKIAARNVSVACAG